MKKPLATRIIGLAALYFIVFCLLIILQFSNSGNFSLTTGAMSFRGRYLAERQIIEIPDNPFTAYLSEEDSQWTGRYITGGVKVFYGGLEFNLKEERGNGLTLTAANGDLIPVNPEYMIYSEHVLRVLLPGGTSLSFNTLETARGPELQITGEFADTISEVTIPIIPRRYSLVQDSGQLGLMYLGSRYMFSSTGQELEKGYMVLSRDNNFISYRSRGKQKVFIPEDYIIAQTEDFESVFRRWQDTSYSQWNQNAASLQNEDDIIAYISGAFARGNYVSAVQSIPRNFINSPRQTYRSSAFLGGMANAYISFTHFENEKLNLITHLTRERSLELLKEDNIIEFLFARSNIVLANEVINIISNAAPESLNIDHCPGLFEIFYDIRRWRPDAVNIINHLTENALSLISDNLIRDVENDTVFASNSVGLNAEYSARLGKALAFWAETTGNKEWALIGKSLILSSILNSHAGALHNILEPVDYYPKAVLLTNDGIWAWTVSQSVRVTSPDGNLNFAVSFSPNMTHHLIIRGVRPFLRIQIHNIDWRTDSQLERYDSSGWVYYPEEQILVLRLRHRASVENVRLIYREAPPPPPPPPVEEIVLE